MHQTMHRVSEGNGENFFFQLVFFLYRLQKGTHNF